jgi:hypothetical protein
VKTEPPTLKSTLKGAKKKEFVPSMKLAPSFLDEIGHTLGDYSVALCMVLAVVLMTGCKRQPSAGTFSSSQNSNQYFQTPFQDESQFIVEAVVSDLAEQMFYAAHHRLPDPKNFQVTATEESGSLRDTPVYELQIHLDPKLSALNSKVNVTGPIWSPVIYQKVASDLARSVGLSITNSDTSQDTSLLAKLADSSPETIEQENQQLSSALEADFQNPALHEQAAVLLGAFLLRDHAGHFFEIRSPLSRMTAHLAMAQFLNGTNSFGINGQMAEVILLTLIGDESPALAKLNAIGTNDVTIAPIVRALWTRNTGDYRLLGQMNDLSPIESIEWFSAMAKNVAVNSAWLKLNDVQQRTIDFVRIANEWYYSVEVGHQLSRVSMQLELQEIGRVYDLSQHKGLTQYELVKALNETPERCFSTAPDGTVHVCVIGWGQWADFLQRHLCHAIQQNFYFLENIWAVPRNAGAFAYQCDEDFSGLWLYPFVQRLDFEDVDTYHKSVDNGFKVTVTMPQLTPADCWNWICFKSNFAPWYRPNPSPHVNEWHYHNPPPGTVYDLGPRLYHPSLVSRPDAVTYFEKLHELAPYDSRVINFILNKKYIGHPTYNEAKALYGNLWPYNLSAIQAVADTVRDQPQEYEKLIVQAAQLDPTCYYTLGDYERNRDDEKRAAQYYDKGCDSDPDADRATDYALWRVRYYLKKGETEKARQIAYAGGQVYSYNGLEAEGVFFEATSNYDQAFEWYKKIETRYNDDSDLVAFCLRYEALTGDTRFESEVQKRLGNVFPKGMEKISLADFHGPPSDGVLIRQQNDLLTSYGLKAGDVIVALGGTRTHTFDQYAYVRDSQTSPELDLIVWQAGVYHEIKAAPPNHRFNADFVDYPQQ